MNMWTKKNGGGLRDLEGELGINASIYPPQEIRRHLPGYSPSLPDDPVAAHDGVIASPPVSPFTFSADPEWQALLDAALGRGDKSRDAEEGDTLEAVIQAIVAHGQDMLPLLRLLRERAESDERLAELVGHLQDRLNRGISAACALAPREMEVLERAAQGESNPEIARGLNVQTVTVAKALSRAYRKLDAKNRTEAVHKWMLLRGMGG